MTCVNAFFGPIKAHKAINKNAVYPAPRSVRGGVAYQRGYDAGWKVDGGTHNWRWYTTWGFAEAGVFWTGQDMLAVGVIGPVCAGPFTSITKAASAAKHKADVSDGSVEDDGEM